MIYLASPYSDPDPDVMRERFEAVCAAAAVLMGAGVHVFSPIAHAHPIAMAGALPTDWGYWREYDEAMIAACTGLLVLMLPGWEQSRGIAAEEEIAREARLPIGYVGPPVDLTNRGMRRLLQSVAPRLH